MARKKVISLEEQFSGVLFGLVTQVKEYQLSWHLNRSLGLNLKRGEDIEIVHKKKKKTSIFSLYSHEDDLDKWMVYVISNKHTGDFLVPEVKQVDYFLMIRGEVSGQREQEMLDKLKSIQLIQLVVPLEYNKLKSKENLIVE